MTEYNPNNRPSTSHDHQPPGRSGSPSSSERPGSAEGCDSLTSCPSWCILGDDHRHDHDVEPLHLSAMVPVPLVLRETVLTDGQVLSTPRGHECWVGLIQCGSDPYITCSAEDGLSLDLTPESSRRLADALTLFLRVLHAP